jgi:hypothetical protein
LFVNGSSSVSTCLDIPVNTASQGFAIAMAVAL